MKVPEKLKHVTKLIKENRHQEALKEVERLESLELVPNDRLSCQFQKCKILLQMDNVEDSLNLAQHVIQEAENLKNNSVALDAIITKVKALKRHGRLEESLETIEKGIEKLNTLNMFQESVSQEREASLLYQYSTIQRLQGENEKALENLQKCLKLRERLGNEKDIARTLYYFGVIYRETFQLDKALEYTYKSLELSEKLNSRAGVAYSLWNIGHVYYWKLDLDLALKYIQKGLVVFEELGRKTPIAGILGTMGEIYKARGEIEVAFEYLQQCLTAHEELGLINLPYAAYVCVLGEVYHAMGENNLAFEYYEKSILVYTFLGSKHFYLLSPLAGILTLCYDNNEPERAAPFIKQMQELCETTEENIYNQAHRLMQGYILRRSTRLKDKVKAQEIFQQVAEEEITTYNVVLIAILNLCYLLLDEFQLTGEEEVLKELKTWINKLFDLAKAQRLYSSLAETYLLQSKLALLELDLQNAQQLLAKAKSIAEEKGIIRLAMIVSLEQESLISQLSKWERIIDQNPSKGELIELTQLDDLIDQMISKRLYRKEDEIREYAEHARTLVEKWEKN